MKKKLKLHADNIGPAVRVELDDISMIEEYGDRESGSGWVEVVLTLRPAKEIKVKVSPEDADALILDWEGVK